MAGAEYHIWLDIFEKRPLQPRNLLNNIVVMTSAVPNQLLVHLHTYNSVRKLTKCVPPYSVSFLFQCYLCELIL